MVDWLRSISPLDDGFCGGNGADDGRYSKAFSPALIAQAARQ